MQKKSLYLLASAGKGLFDWYSDAGTLVAAVTGKWVPPNIREDDSSS
jgi:hypothetical protein